MKKLFFLLLLVGTFFCGCIQQSNTLKTGDTVYIKPDSIKGVVATVYGSGQVNVYYQDSSGTIITFATREDSLWFTK
jgi:hypothetical protein